MSAPIMFYAYVPELGKTVDVFAVNPMNHTVYLSHVQLFGTEGDDVLMKYGDEADKVKLRQATGVTDRYGTEIYEGDLIALKYIVGNRPNKLVKKFAATWDQRRARFTFRGIGMQEIGTTVSASKARQSWIIGNVYENPGMLHDNPSLAGAFA